MEVAVDMIRMEDKMVVVEILMSATLKRSERREKDGRQQLCKSTDNSILKRMSSLNDSDSSSILLNKSKRHVVLAKYNIITCYAWRNKSTPCAARKEEKTPIQSWLERLLSSPGDLSFIIFPLLHYTMHSLNHYYLHHIIALSTGGG